VSDLEITAATPGDFDWCAQLIGRSDPWKRFGITAEKFRPLLDRPGSETYVARCDGRKLGFLRLTLYTISSQPLINTLVIEEDARNQGVGSALLRHAIARFPDRRFIFLQVSDFNTDARRLYARHGFVQVGAVPDCFESGHAELLLAKRLVP